VDEHLRELLHLVHVGHTNIGAENRAERYRWSQVLLGLRLVTLKDGTLEVSGTFGGRMLAPGEPSLVELPPPGYEAGALSGVSDSHR
jgi:hypothetical protein